MRLCVHTRLKGRVGVEDREGRGGQWREVEENGQEKRGWREERESGGEALERGRGFREAERL